MKIKDLHERKVFSGQDLLDLFSAMEDEGVWDYEENDEQTRHDYLSDLGYTEEDADTVQDLYDHCGGCSPNTIVKEDYFTEYAKDYAEGCGYVDKDNPLTGYVNWDEYAEDMKHDFSVLETGTYTFFVSDY